MEYTAMGDAVNLAARMQAAADPGTVQIAESTYRLVAPLFDCQSLGEILVKGKSEPVPAYRVLGRKAQPCRRRYPRPALADRAGGRWTPEAGKGPAPGRRGSSPDRRSRVG
jgi:hypothetical protein